MDVALGVLLGSVLVASAIAARRLLKPAPVLGIEGTAMQAALHAAALTLPHLRRGLAAGAADAAPHLRTLTQAAAVALVDRTRLLAFDGAGADHHVGAGETWPLLREGPPDRVHVEPAVRCEHPDCPLGAAVVAPLAVQGERVGSLIAFYRSGGRISPESTRVVQEAASLVSGQLELSTLDEQGERLARAELEALRAQISPHFVYNALAAVAGYIHSRPEEARELLTEFAEFIRYAFRREQPFVTLADELHYVRTYLRLEQARFGDRLRVRVEVAPEVLQAVVPVLSVQPLVENAVRHGVESVPGPRLVQIVGRDLGPDVELEIVDDGAGMTPERAHGALSGEAGGIGLPNVHQRLQAAYGTDYGLQIRSRPGEGTTVVMSFPKFRAGVRAA